MHQQSTSHLFMIEPVEFYANEQTAYTNHYQKAVSDEAADKIAEKAGRSKSDAEQFLNATLSTIQDTLSSGESIPLVGFGTFSVASRAARTGKNPQTGAAIQIPASKTVKFKVGSKLKDAVNK